MRQLRSSTLPKYLKQFPYLVYGVHVFDSQVLTRLRPGILCSRGDGTFLWVITDHGQQVEWEFSERSTALEIQRNESHVRDVLFHLRDLSIPDQVRARIRMCIINICLDVEQEIARPSRRPTLCTQYPSPKDLLLS